MANIYLSVIEQLIFVAQFLMFILLIVGYWLAEEKYIINHRMLMRYMFWVQTVLNVPMIYLFIVIPADVNYIPHMIISTPIYLLIVYTYLVMEKKLPESLMVPRERRPLLMKITALVWGIAIFSGIMTFIFLATT